MIAQRLQPGEPKIWFSYVNSHYFSSHSSDGASCWWCAHGVKTFVSYLFARWQCSCINNCGQDIVSSCTDQFVSKLLFCNPCICDYFSELFMWGNSFRMTSQFSILYIIIILMIVCVCVWTKTPKQKSVRLFQIYCCDFYLDCLYEFLLFHSSCFFMLQAFYTF